MTMNTYSPLAPGDEIRVIAPSSSWQAKRAANYERAQRVLEDLGYKVTFGMHVKNVQRLGTASVADRLADFHAAYADPSVKLVLAMHGGWACNALLPGIDWDLVRSNPKPLTGFSDITALLNALYVETGTPQYLGPNFASLGKREASDYTVQNMHRVLQASLPVELTRSRHWEPKHKKPLARTRPWLVLQSGEAEGVAIGGNIGTFYLLQGTPWQPAFDKPTILLAEDDDQSGVYTAQEFDRRLESILQLPGARGNIAGILIGRFQPASKVSLPDVGHIVKRLGLGNIPVVADVDFGHTWPMLTLPIGGRLHMRASTKPNTTTINLVQ